MMRPSMLLWFLSWATLGVLLAVYPGCGPSPTPPGPPADGDCVAACHHLADLGCAEAKPTPSGKPCEEWLCAYAQKPAGISASCLEHVASCGDVSRCGRLVATLASDRTRFACHD